MKIMLKGLDELKLEIKKGLKAKLPIIGLYVSKACNFKCKYCFGKEFEYEGEFLTLEQRIDVLKQAKDLGAKVLHISGDGEPLLDKDFDAIVEAANKLGFTTAVYTNGTNIDWEKARFMKQNNVVPLIKLESLNMKVHNRLCGTSKQVYKNLTPFGTAYNAIFSLLEAGYGRLEKKGKDYFSDIGVAAIISKKNIADLEYLQKWCEQRDKNISFAADYLEYHGAAKKYKKQLEPTPEQIKEYSPPKETTMDLSVGCLFYHYGLIIGPDGVARRCATQPEEKPIGNVKYMALSKILDNVKQERQKEIQRFIADPDNYTCPFKRCE